MFRENNIEIPFPQRDLHIRSGKPVEENFTTLVSKDKNVDLKDPQIDE